MKAASCFFRLGSALLIAAVSAVAGPVRAQDASPPQPNCTAPADLARLDIPLNRTARKIASGAPLTIVAIGSSSTAGSGASSPALSYPSRLAAELHDLFPRVPITVHNRGIGGETSSDMLARFDRDVFAANPDLVIWQAGSNSVLRDHPLSGTAPLLREGLARLKAAGVDIILMNPQYAPKVITKHDIDGMVDLMALIAKQAHVNIFERFALMRYWRLTEDMPFSAFLSPDELHLNDWSYGCIAKLLARSIEEAVTRPTLTATVRGAR